GFADRHNTEAVVGVMHYPISKTLGSAFAVYRVLHVYVSVAKESCECSELKSGTWLGREHCVVQIFPIAAVFLSTQVYQGADLACLDFHYDHGAVEALIL